MICRAQPGGRGLRAHERDARRLGRMGLAIVCRRGKRNAGLPGCRRLPDAFDYREVPYFSGSPAEVDSVRRKPVVICRYVFLCAR